MEVTGSVSSFIENKKAAGPVMARIRAQTSMVSAMERSIYQITEKSIL